MDDDVFCRFDELAAHVKDSGLPFREAIVDYYAKLGEAQRHTVRTQVSVIQHGLNFGKLELLWLEPRVAFATEFGAFEEILKTLWRLVEFSPDKAVLLLSSKSACKPKHVAALLSNSKPLAELREKCAILDVSENRLVYPLDEA